MSKRIWIRKSVALLMLLAIIISTISTDVIVSDANEVSEEVHVAIDDEISEEVIGEVDEEVDEKVNEEVGIVDELEEVEKVEEHEIEEVQYEDVSEIVSELATFYEDTIFEEVQDFSSKVLLVQLVSQGTLESYDLEIARMEVGADFYILSFETEEDTEVTYKKLLDDANVLAVEVDTVTSLTPTTVVSQEEDDTQWNTQEKEILDGYEVYTQSIDTTIPVTIALIDTEVEGESDRIQESITLLESSTGVSEDGEGQYENHGEALADLFLTYTADAVTILPITAFNDDGTGTVLSAYLAILTAIDEEVDVLNLSFSGLGSSTLLELAITQAKEAGIVVVVAAGNDGGNTKDYMPANIEQAITVGAITNEDNIASYSNVGNSIDLVAYEEYRYQNECMVGTSIAAAYVSVASALLIQGNVGDSVSELEEYLFTQASDLGPEGKDTTYGYGKVALIGKSDQEDVEDIMSDSEGLNSEESNNEVSDSEMADSENADSVITDGEMEDGEIIEDETVGNAFPRYEELAQILGLAMTTDPSSFYWSSSLGDEGNGVVAYDGCIYWCNRAYKASDTSSVFYDNLGWYVKLTGANSKTLTFYLSESSCLYKSEETENYYFYLFRIDQDDLKDAVDDAGYNVTNFFNGTVKVEMNGYVRLHKNGTTLAGPYNLTSDSNLETLLAKMSSYGFSSQSLTAVKSQYQDKIFTMDGTEVIEVTFSYDANGGSVSPATQTGTYGNTVTMPTPTRTGYTFTGWKCDQTGTLFSTNGNTSTRTLTKDYSFTAQWERTEYKITFNANGGTVASGYASVTKYVGDSFYVYWAYTPTRTGYTFQGWGTYASDTSVNYERGSTYYPSASATWYAIWEIDTYNVTYSANTTDTVSGMPSTQTKTYGKSLTLTNSTPTRSGYLFQGWGTYASDTSANYQPGGSYTSNSAITLYAIWKEAYYIDLNFYLNGSSSALASAQSIATADVYINGTLVANDVTDYYKIWVVGTTYQVKDIKVSSGYANIGATSFSGTVSGTSKIAVQIGSQYSITYNDNTTDTVSGMPSTQTKTYGKTLTLTNSTPTRSGYLFQGWGTYASDTSANYQPGGSYTSNSAITLYAIWKEAYYIDLNFYLDGSTSALASAQSIATADVYINGSLVSNDVTDYYKMWVIGTAYVIKDIKTADGYGNAGATSYSGTTTGTTRVGVQIGTLYYLDLNHIVNGTLITSATDYASCDIYINGTRVANDVTSYYIKWPYGTTYEIKDIKSLDGYTYTGESSYSGTITASTAVNLPVSSVHTNNAELFAYGFTNGEGTNSNHTLYKLERTTWTQTYGTNYATYKESDFDIPKGYYFNATTWMSSTLGTSKTYTIPATVTQEAASMSFDYTCSPYTYTITYELGDGIMEEENPATYNVLYEVLFENEPEKEGYSFAGWEIDGEVVEGINVGVDASFSSADDLYEQLEKRTTGDITVTATWNAKPELEVEDVYMYLENELEEERILQDVFAMDEEDGEITHLVTYNLEEIVTQLEELRKIELTEDTEYQIEILYEVTDEFGHEETECAVLHVYGIYDDTYEMALAKSGYVRFIAEDYLDTLQETSKWRDAELWTYLTEIL